MNFDTELRDIDLKKYTPVDCSAFVLFPRGKIKNLYFKSTNKIRGSYFDSVLKENIYLSSNNLKKNAYLKKVELDTNFLQLDKNFFTTYFKKIEDNLFRFNIFPKKYQKDLTYHCLTNKSVKKAKVIQLSQYYYKNIQKLNKKYNQFVGSANRLILIQSFWQKAYFITPRGFVLNLTKRFGGRNFFTGLNYIYSKRAKFKFKSLMMLNHFLIKFFSNLVTGWAKNKDLMCTIELYFALRNKMNDDFFDHHHKKKLKYRKSNILLRLHYRLLKKRTRKVVKYFYLLSLDLIRDHYNTNKNWISNLFVDKRNYLPLKYYSKQIELSTKVNNLLVADKLTLLRYLFNFLKYKFASVKIKVNDYSSSFFKALYYKSILLLHKSDLLIENFNYKLSFLVDEVLNRRVQNVRTITNIFNDKSNFLVTKKFKFTRLLDNRGHVKTKLRLISRHLLHPYLKHRTKKYKVLRLMFNRKYPYFFNKNTLKETQVLNNNFNFYQEELINNFYTSKSRLIKILETKRVNNPVKEYFLEAMHEIKKSLSVPSERLRKIRLNWTSDESLVLEPGSRDYVSLKKNYLRQRFYEKRKNYKKKHQFNKKDHYFKLITFKKNYYTLRKNLIGRKEKELKKKPVTPKRPIYWNSNYKGKNFDPNFKYKHKNKPIKEIYNGKFYPNKRKYAVKNYENNRSYKQ